MTTARVTVCADPDWSAEFQGERAVERASAVAALVRTCLKRAKSKCAVSLEEL